VFYTQLHAYEFGTECSETSAYKLQTPGNYPEESMQQMFSDFAVMYEILWNNMAVPKMIT